METKNSNGRKRVDDDAIKPAIKPIELVVRDYVHPHVPVHGGNPHPTLLLNGMSYDGRRLIPHETRKVRFDYVGDMGIVSSFGLDGRLLCTPRQYDRAQTEMLERRYCTLIGVAQPPMQPVDEIL